MRCLVCQEERVKEILDCGNHPIASRFLRSPGEEEETFSLVVGQCEACGLVQLVTPVPAEKLRPLYPWIFYREPEEHLDVLADTLSRLPMSRGSLRILGMSKKDVSLLCRLRERDLFRRGLFVCQEDKEAGETEIGVGRTPLSIDSSEGEVLKEGEVKADIVVLRHTLEHSYSPKACLETIASLLKPEGYLVVEVPDCQSAFESRDYTVIWEEHIVYFTSHTFLSTLKVLGWEVISFHTFPYPMENALVAIAKRAEGQEALVDSKEGKGKVRQEIIRAAAFAESFQGRKSKVSFFLRSLHKEGKRIALLGAGHLGCMFLNIFDLRRICSFVVDDNPNKQGLFFPGTRLPIEGSAQLERGCVDVCLLAVNPQVEEKVIAKYRGLEEQGKVFLSIFPASCRSLWRGIADRNPYAV